MMEKWVVALFLGLLVLCDVGVRTSSSSRIVEMVWWDKHVGFGRGVVVTCCGGCGNDG